MLSCCICVCLHNFVSVSSLSLWYITYGVTFFSAVLPDHLSFKVQGNSLHLLPLLFLLLSSLLLFSLFSCFFVVVVSVFSRALLFKTFAKNIFSTLLLFFIGVLEIVSWYCYCYSLLWRKTAFSEFFWHNPHRRNAAEPAKTVVPAEFESVFSAVSFPFRRFFLHCFLLSCGERKHLWKRMSKRPILTFFPGRLFFASIVGGANRTRFASSLICEFSLKAKRK